MLVQASKSDFRQSTVSGPFWVYRTNVLWLRKTFSSRSLTKPALGSSERLARDGPMWVRLEHFGNAHPTSSLHNWDEFVLVFSTSLIKTDFLIGSSGVRPAACLAIQCVVEEKLPGRGPSRSTSSQGESMRHFSWHPPSDLAPSLKDLFVKDSFSERGTALALSRHRV